MNKKTKNQTCKKNLNLDDDKNLNSSSQNDCDLDPLTPIQRRKEAFDVRENAALYQMNAPLPGHPCNGDENLYPNKIGNFSKALPHNLLGEVDLNSYNIFMRALSTGNSEMFEAIPMGGARKLANPQACFAYDLMGADSHHLNMPIPPAFSSTWRADEMIEEYWFALTRDVSFINYDSNIITNTAASDLSNLTDFKGPKENGMVTTDTLFRGNTPGDLVGPYISQLLCKDVPYGARTMLQIYNNPVSDKNFMVTYDEWLNIQNGALPNEAITFSQPPRYIRNGRDLGQLVHVDFTYQEMLSACLILQNFGPKALDSQNPYRDSKTQTGFVTFGPAQVLDFVAKAARVALEAAWFQKFSVQRVLRPEAFGGCIHNNLTGSTNFPINSELFTSSVIPIIYKKYGTYLLPMAYPEGSPTHPSYPAGHAAMAGACATILKAFFNESFVIPNPVIVNNTGCQLLPYSGPDLTIGGELNKLASNISFGRNFAGVHWRTDSSEGMNLGEAVAISILQDYTNTYNENFDGFILTKFDGTTIIIG